MSFLQGLWLSHVRPLNSSSLASDTYNYWVLVSFLWADDTRGALQVFLPQQFIAVENPGGVIRQEGIEEGIWITADPNPGCIVCNIGESTWMGSRSEVRFFSLHLVWEIWTNGLYKSTLHRVIHRGSNYR